MESIKIKCVVQGRGDSYSPLFITQIARVIFCDCAGGTVISFSRIWQLGRDPLVYEKYAGADSVGWLCAGHWTNAFWCVALSLVLGAIRMSR